VHPTSLGNYHAVLRVPGLDRRFAEDIAGWDCSGLRLRERWLHLGSDGGVLDRRVGRPAAVLRYGKICAEWARTIGPE